MGVIVDRVPIDYEITSFNSVLPQIARRLVRAKLRLRFDDFDQWQDIIAFIDTGASATRFHPRLLTAYRGKTKPLIHATGGWSSSAHGRARTRFVEIQMSSTNGSTIGITAMEEACVCEQLLSDIVVGMDILEKTSLHIDPNRMTLDWPV
jgi:hypothetical protein